MKVCTTTFLILASSLTSATADPKNTAFHREKLFGIQRGGKTSAAVDTSTSSPPKVSSDDYDRAEKAIFDAVGKLEEKVQHAVEEEVDTIYHELHHTEKEEIKQKAKASVEKSAKKVKKSVEEHDHSTEQKLPEFHVGFPYPYDWPHSDPDHRILHAVESAEKAVLHAVEEEVSSLFHELDDHHHDDGNETPKDDGKMKNKNKKAPTTTKHHVEKTLKNVHEKATKHVDEKHEHRRNWFMRNLDGNPIDEYMRADVEPME